MPDRDNSLDELLESLFLSGKVPAALQERINTNMEYGETTENLEDHFAMHELVDYVVFSERHIEVVLKSYYADGNYSGNSVSLLTPFRLTSALREMLRLRAAGRIFFEALDLYVDFELENGALVFDQRFAIRFSIGRKRRKGNYYASILESEQSVVDGKVTKWGAILMIENIFRRLVIDESVSNPVPAAMRKLMHQLRRAQGRGVFCSFA